MEKPDDEPDFNMDEELEYEHLYADEYMAHEAEIMAEFEEEPETSSSIVEVAAPTSIATPSSKLNGKPVDTSLIDSPISPQIALNREHGSMYGAPALFCVISNFAPGNRPSLYFHPPITSINHTLEDLKCSNSFQAARSSPT
jgi:hypothetical protein